MAGEMREIIELRFRDPQTIGRSTGSHFTDHSLLAQGWSAWWDGHEVVLQGPGMARIYPLSSVQYFCLVDPVLPLTKLPANSDVTVPTLDITPGVPVEFPRASEKVPEPLPASQRPGPLDLRAQGAEPSRPAGRVGPAQAGPAAKPKGGKGK